MPTKRKRVTSPELVEIRTVLSRAKTALKTIDGISSHLKCCLGCEYEHESEHAAHDLSMMRSALTLTIEALGTVELAYGYRSAE